MVKLLGTSKHLGKKDIIRIGKDIMKRGREHTHWWHTIQDKLKREWAKMISIYRLRTYFYNTPMGRYFRENNVYYKHLILIDFPQYTI